jgi:hypothetical protein
MAKPKPNIDPSQLLDAIPTVNEAVRTEQRGETLVLFVPIRRRWWNSGPSGWLLPFRGERGIALDALGREVFDACDGHSTTEQIIELFAARHRLRFHEARLNVLSFLRSLMERNLVVFVLPKGLEAS